MLRRDPDFPVNGREISVIVLCLVLVCGCQLLFEPFDSRDSLEKVTSETWMIAARFLSGRNLIYEQRSGSFAGYSRSNGRGERLPVLTNVVAQVKDSKDFKYTLSGEQISRLRDASGGELRLVLYDEGIACMSPAMNEAIAELGKHPYDKQKRLQLLRDQRDEALKWTRDVVTNSGTGH